jgi:nucleoside-diphosphate-sugar epimerase
MKTMDVPEALVIFGATSPVALTLARRAIEAGIQVIAVIRESSDASAIENAGAKVLRADIMNPDSLSALAGSLPEHAWFFSALGGRPGDSERIDSVGNCNAIDTALKCQAARFLLITTVGAGDSHSALPEHLIPILGPIAAEKTIAESHLKDSGLSYTILRPGHLLTEKPTGSAILVEDPRTLGAVTRDDLAALALAALRSEDCADRTFAVADRNMLRSEFPVTPFELAGETA